MKTRYNENVDIAEQAVYINKLIAGEHKNWIPEKWVENFEFLWSHSFDQNWWYFLHKDFDYIYLDRNDWWKVTIQRCLKDIKEKNPGDRDHVCRDRRLLYVTIRKKELRYGNDWL